MGLMVVCLIGLSVYQLYEPVSLGAVITKEKLDRVAENLNQRQPMKPLEMSDYARQMGVSIDQPASRRFATNDTFTLSGQVKQATALKNHYIWVQIDYEGSEPRADFLKTFQYYIPLQGNHRFEKRLQLTAGKGKYKVTVRLPSSQEKDQFYKVTTLEVTNVNPEIKQGIAYSMTAYEHGLQLESPATGLIKTNRTVQVKGKARAKQLLIQLRKDDQVWKRLITTANGQFAAKIPLLFGDGIHKVQVMLPSSTKANYFVEGASFYVQNASELSSQPIEFTHLYRERGIHLTQPMSSGEQADLSYQVRGTIDRQAKGASQLTHLIVQTEKGKDKATYFIPVQNYRFNGKFWLRFGAGAYRVTLFVPELNSKNRDYFRFFAVASFRVNSHAQGDYRDLLPGRGIQSDHPQIQALSRQLTEGQSSDYQKAKKIYSYVAKKMRYDMVKLHRNSFAWDDSALKSLRLKKGVCQDYVFLAIALLRAADIPARFVEGEAGNQRHAWIEARIKDQWVSMDPTWGSGYINTEGQFIKKYDSSYFNPSADYLYRTHKRTGVVY